MSRPIPPASIAAAAIVFTRIDPSPPLFAAAHRSSVLRP
jgi:hypothetical protein